MVLLLVYTALLTIVLYTYVNNRPKQILRSQAALDNRRVIDSALALMQDGDVLLRAGNDMISSMLASVNTEDKTYSHCGIVIYNEGSPYIYHSIGGEDNPNQRLKYDDAKEWLQPEHIDGFALIRYNLDNVELANLDSIVKEYYKKPVLFDIDFDLKTDDRVYCSEFVYKSIVSALNDSSLITVDTLYGRPFIGVDKLFLNRRAKFICKVKFK